MLACARALPYDYAVLGDGLVPEELAAGVDVPILVLAARATRTSHLVRPLVAALVALVAAMAVLLIAYSASPAHAEASCSTASGTTTCTFGPTGAEDTFVVPAGVNTPSTS
jgi:hypothetical protein